MNTNFFLIRTVNSFRRLHPVNIRVSSWLNVFLKALAKSTSYGKIEFIILIAWRSSPSPYDPQCNGAGGAKNVAKDHRRNPQGRFAHSVLADGQSWSGRAEQQDLNRQDRLDKAPRRRRTIRARSTSSRT